MSGKILAPLGGTVCPLADVPDPVFSQGMMGPGVAIDPQGEGEVDVVAPIAGTIAKVHPHAVVIRGDKVNVLVHLGLDTVKLEGQGFTVHVADKDKIEAGQKLITWSPQGIRDKGLNPICPIIFMDTGVQVEYTLDAAQHPAIEVGEQLAQVPAE